MSDDRPNLITRLWHACLLILGSTVCLWLAIQLVSKIWLVLVVGFLVASLVAGFIWWLRARRNRW